MNITLTNVTEDDINDCINLIRTTFDVFVGHEYSNEGRETFYSFIDASNMSQRLNKGHTMICAKVEGVVVGFQEIRDRNHIALFFVDPRYHGNGIGRKLFEHSKSDIIRNYPDVTEITVHSSLYAEKIYKRLGFTRTAEPQERDGIRYVPMKHRIKKK